MSEVSRIDELKRALLHNEKEILVVNEKLSQEIFEKSKTYRFIRYAMQVNGYEVVKADNYGVFNVKFIKYRN